MLYDWLFILQLDICKIRSAWVCLHDRTCCTRCVVLCHDDRYHDYYTSLLRVLPQKLLHDIATLPLLRVLPQNNYYTLSLHYHYSTPLRHIILHVITTKSLLHVITTISLLHETAQHTRLKRLLAILALTRCHFCQLLTVILGFTSGVAHFWNCQSH